MVKGNERRVVVVKDVESEYFESAIFVIKSGVKPPKNNRTLSEEACVIIRKLFGLKPPTTTAITNKVFPSVVKLTAAAAIGAALMGVISRL